MQLDELQECVTHVPQTRSTLSTIGVETIQRLPQGSPGLLTVLRNMLARNYTGVGSRRSLLFEWHSAAGRLRSLSSDHGAGILLSDTEAHIVQVWAAPPAPLTTCCLPLCAWLLSVGTYMSTAKKCQPGGWLGVCTSRRPRSYEVCSPQATSSDLIY